MAQKVEIEISARLDQALSQMKAMQDQLNAVSKSAAQASKQVNDNFEKIAKSSASASAKFNQATEQIKVLQSQMKDMQNKLATMEHAAKRASDIAVKSFSDVSKSAGVTDNSFMTLRQGVVSLASAFGLYAGANAVVNFFREGVRGAVEFESAIRSINAILPDGQRVTEGLQKSLKDLAAQYGTDAQSQAKGYYEILQAGIKDTVKIQELLAVSNKASIAGLTDLGTTSRVLSSVLNAYAKSGLTATEASDKLFSAVVEGQTTFQELAGTIGRVTPIAAAANVSLGEVAGSVAYLTKSGIQTDEAVTGMRQALADIIKPTKQATELAKQLGIDFSAAALQSKGFAGVMNEVRLKTGGSQEAIALLFEDIRAQVAVTSILKGNWEDYVKVMTTVQESTGQTSKAFKEQSQSYEFLINQLKSSFSIFAQTIGETVLPAIIGVVKGLTSGLKVFTDWNKALSVLSAVPGALGSIAKEELRVRKETEKYNKNNEEYMQKVKEHSSSYKSSLVERMALTVKNSALLKTQTEEEKRALEEKAKALAKKFQESREQAKSNIDSLIGQLEKVGMSQLQLIEKEKKDRLKLISDAAGEGAITAKQASEFRTQVEKDATDKINKYREKEEEELLKKNKKMFDDAYANPLITLFSSIFKNVQLDVNSALGVAGGIGSSLSQGAAGAGALISSTAAAGLNAFAPGLGDAAKPFIEMLGASEEQMRNTIRGFADGAVTFIENLISNIPLLIEELINGASRIIDRLVQDAPRIITKLIEDTPKIITALASNMSFVAGELAAGLIAEAPNIAAALIKAIPQAASGAIGGSGRSIGGFFKKIGFAEGGQATVKSVPSGFPNDTYPAMLTSQELVVDRSTAFRLKEFLQNEEKTKSSKSQQQYMPMGDIVVSIDGREIARAVRSQVKQGFAL